MVCWTQCSIYSNLRFPSIIWHNDGEPGRDGEEKGEQEERGVFPPVLPHELNTNWKAMRVESLYEAVCALLTLLSEP